MRGMGCRYIRMKVGDAIVEVLDESEEPLTLDQIIAALTWGGLFVRDSRTANAALINTKGIKKLDDGRYMYEKEVNDPFKPIGLGPFERLV